MYRVRKSLGASDKETNFKLAFLKFSPYNISFKKRLLMQLTAIFQKVPQGYIAFVEELPGVNTQGTTLEETKENLIEATRLVLETNRKLAEKSIKGKKVIRQFIPAEAV